MITLSETGVYICQQRGIINECEALKTLDGKGMSKENAKKGTITYSILKSHNTSLPMENLKLKFDSLASHDITYVGIIQTAKASGMDKFPLPYVLTNCHNSLCAVGGTINGDDHLFGLSAAKKYGGIYVPAHMAVIHQYMRETMAGCGKMMLGSDSHTRYGALGTMGIGEGGGELVKQLLEKTYDIPYPEVIAVYLEGKPIPGVGPQDVALAIIGAVFKKGYVKNKVMEFIGPGVGGLPTDYRNGIDVMTTETACLSSIWETDHETKVFFKTHGREEDYKELKPKDMAYYDGMIRVNLSEIRPMIALPFHPSHTYEIETLNENLEDILRAVEREAAVLTTNNQVDFKLTDKIKNGKLTVQQGIIAGCAGGSYSNIMEAAQLLKDGNCGNHEFSLSVYPSSQPVYMELLKKGAISNLMAAGAIVKTAFCGPCFGAGDTPANQALSIRHTTRNFHSREGSKPISGQLAAVALMDARSIATTAANGGILTPATKYAKDDEEIKYCYDDASYKARVFQGFNREQESVELIKGPNIKDWPELMSLKNHLLLKVCSKIMDDVTTTDELIPSGETSSYRSNPLGLAEFTLSRRDPEYVSRAKAVKEMEEARLAGNSPEWNKTYEKLEAVTPGVEFKDISVGSVIYCVRPGDGSAREQAASCQRVLGGVANICQDYATKRYRSNVINWGMVPFQLREEPSFEVGDYIYVPRIKEALAGRMDQIRAYVINEKMEPITLYIEELTETEKEIIKAGSLINYNRNQIG